MKISLTPRTTEFFLLFMKAGENALEVAQLVERRFHEHPSSTVTQEQVKAAETAGDAITRDLITLLNTTQPRSAGRPACRAASATIGIASASRASTFRTP